MICIRYIGFGLLKILVVVVLAKSKCGLKVSLFKGNLASFQSMKDATGSLSLCLTLSRMKIKVLMKITNKQNI